MSWLLWSVVAVLAGLWSVTVWLCHVVVAALLGGAGHLPVKEIALPEAWTNWLPQPVSESITQMLEAAQPVLAAVLDYVPALAGGLTVVAWVVWALGAALLVLAGVASHLALRWWRRSQRPAPRATLRPS
ncbi:hypothetical protein ACG02S_03605 [Roseateles sp. DC23W]|uniref:Uncharacterized protein n=1 Tax=Pelomonas dachongensis TaxID=3299029 RepID=A0ABW7ELS5_9BURK